MMVTYTIIIVLSTLLLTATASRTTKNALHKCCPLDKKLVFTNEGLSCVKTNVSSQKTDGWWWLPRETLSSNIRAVLQKHDVVYDSMPGCKENSMDVLVFDVRLEMIDFSFHLRGDEIRLDVLKESSFHDASRGRNDSFPTSTFCVDAGLKNRYVALLCPCSLIPCVRKCCSDAYAFNTANGKCEDVEHIEGASDWVPEMGGDFEYYRLPFKMPSCDKRSSHVIANQSKQSQLLLFPNASIKALDSQEIFSADEYCGTYTVDNDEMLITCMKKIRFDWTFVIYGVLFLIGAAALLVTVTVTAILPEMRRNIHGKMAMAHNAMLFVGYTATGVSQLRGSNITISGCATISFIMQFSILSAFFWLNVMCVDISWTFSGLRPIRGTTLQRDRKKFISYSLYAWGTTALISTATAITEYSPAITRFKPNFGRGQCFFNDRAAMFVFFYGPMAMLLLANLMLFMYTAFKILAVERDTAILTAKDSSTNTKNKQKLILYVKLFCLMGVTFVTEVISWAVGGTSYWWYLTDTINILRAVFIFVIFCCKRTVYNLIRNKWDPRPSHRSPASTQTRILLDRK